jgi:hypothetical protein
VNAVYHLADAILSPGSLVRGMTRCKYATLARMARAAGDLPLAESRKLRTRLKVLGTWGLVRYVASRRCYELTAAGWRLLVQVEQAYALRLEAQAARFAQVVAAEVAKQAP